MDNTKPVLLVGCGHLGSALLKNWIAQHAWPGGFAVVGRSKPDFLPKDIPYHGVDDPLPPSLQPAIIIFAVRPDQLLPCLPVYYSFFEKGAMGISTAVGKSTNQIQQMLLNKTKLVRVMPNLPAEVGLAATAAYANKNMTDDDKKHIDALFGKIGRLVWLPDENMMEAVTAISGSGPGYTFLFAQYLLEAAEAMGLPTEIATPLVRATIAGSGQMLLDGSKAIPELAASVATKGGTTAAAFDIFNHEEILKKIIQAAVSAAKRRADEIAKSN